jgi:stringent starvation protein B
MQKMTSSRPYMIRALYEWIVDNNLTPYLLVDVLVVGVEVPQEYVKDGQIVLNIAPRAVRDMLMTNDSITFMSRFGGVPRQIKITPASVLAIYAKENGRGMVFEAEDPDSLPPTPTPAASGSTKSKLPSKSKAGKPTLKVVK